jgi:hypothetical protein
MNIPKDKASTCNECHSQMYRPADAFRHDWHADPDGAAIACNRCHDASQNRTAASAKKCDDCHTDLIPAGAKIKVDSYQAASYTDAMHDLCVSCHREKAAANAERAQLAECATCHTGKGPDYLREAMRDQLKPRPYNRVLLPGVALSEPAESKPDGPAGESE